MANLVRLLQESRQSFGFNVFIVTTANVTVSTRCSTANTHQWGRFGNRLSMSNKSMTGYIDNRPLTAMDNPAVRRARFVSEWFKVTLLYFGMKRFLPSNFFVPLM